MICIIYEHTYCDRNHSSATGKPKIQIYKLCDFLSDIDAPQYEALHKDKIHQHTRKTNKPQRN